MINTIVYSGQQEVEKEGKKIIVPVSPAIILQARGAIISVIITHPKSVADKLLKEGKEVPAMQINALIDTGASNSVITPMVAEKLKLLQTGFQSVNSVQDEQMRPLFFASIRFQWGRGKEVPVVSCPLKGFDCLIGRDILLHWHLTYNGNDGFITICD